MSGVHEVFVTTAHLADAPARLMCGKCPDWQADIDDTSIAEVIRLAHDHEKEVGHGK